MRCSMNSDEIARLLYRAHRRDLENAKAYFAAEQHLGMLEARKLAYDPTGQTAAQAEHLLACRHCPRLLSHLRDTIVHPGTRDLAAWAEGALTGSISRELQLHLEADGCHACSLRLRRSPKVAAYRALIAAGRVSGTGKPVRHPLCTFVPVTLGLRLADQSSTVEILAMDRENGISARLWQVENGTLEVVVRANDTSMADTRLRVELVGTETSWGNEVVLNERDEYGWVGRCTVGAAGEVLSRLVGNTGNGLAFTVILPVEGSSKSQSSGVQDHGELSVTDERHVLTCLSEPNAMVRYAAVRSISSNTAAAPILEDRLIAMLKEPQEDPSIRAAAADALGSFGLGAVTSTSVEALRQMLEDDELSVREAAVTALRAIAE
jgi:HEAT repeats